jgi:hypothetical protein
MRRGINIAPGSMKSAPKIAEERAHESGAAPRNLFRASMGIRVSRQVGQKFELTEAPPREAGEAKPRPALVETGQQVPPAPPPTPKSVAARLWRGFRRWFANN